MFVQQRANGSMALKLFDQKFAPIQEHQQGRELLAVIVQMHAHLFLYPRSCVLDLALNVSNDFGNAQVRFPNS